MRSSRSQDSCLIWSTGSTIEVYDCLNRISKSLLYLSEAKIWILDEIFTAIDKQGVAQFENLLLEKAISGVTIILTTHHQLSLPGLEILPIKGSVI
ncbi:hypothetical protein A3729_11910 [Oleiphilus sp. HI0043]|nr:hypothetical protein A3729_11910 [Oleiphilus sp. HI0043]